LPDWIITAILIGGSYYFAEVEMSKNMVVLISCLLIIAGLAGCGQAASPPDNSVESHAADNSMIEPTNTAKIYPIPTEIQAEQVITSSQRRIATTTLRAVDEESVALVESIKEEKPVSDKALDAGLQTLVTQAKEDLADQLDVEPDQIELIEAEYVVWPDGSLGCPHPDMMYPQVQQDGVFIRLKVDGQFYNYHGGGKRPLFLCENSTGKPASAAPVQ
jgi:hypothetical protein